MAEAPAIAVAICTFNPDERLLTRVLAAVAAQQFPAAWTVEYVIVDNNSTSPVAELAPVRRFLERLPSARVIREPRPGLSYARIAAIDATTAPLLCFVDDDNEPAADYLQQAHAIFAATGCIGALGPGRVVVDFVDPVSEWFAREFAHHFQQKDHAGLTYGCVANTWTDYYPPGSCMVVRREVLTHYRDAYLSGSLTASDRIGASLASGGDTQIVWEAVKLGYAAGISGTLSASHMIPARRSTLQYMKRLSYGTSSSYVPALVSSFPEQRALIPPPPSDALLFRAAMKLVARRALRGKMNRLPIDLAALFGGVMGTLRATGAPERKWVTRAIKLLRLE